MSASLFTARDFCGLGYRDVTPSALLENVQTPEGVASGALQDASQPALISRDDRLAAFHFARKYNSGGCLRCVRFGSCRTLTASLPLSHPSLEEEINREQFDAGFHCNKKGKVVVRILE
jgi:hypothetical protein